MSAISNPRRILETLESFLNSPVELVLYGRSALHLGFDAPSEYGATMDVDVILPALDILEFERNEDFWLAIDKTNAALSDRGLYFSHIFEEKQIILTSDWHSHRVPLEGMPFEKMRLFRPAIRDLILTKMMRIDPEDHRDIQFLMKQRSFTQQELIALFEGAVVPDIDEIKEAFRSNQEFVLGICGT